MDKIFNGLAGLFGLRRGFLLDLRILALLIPALLILSADMPVLLTLGYAIAAMLVVVVVGHLVRRILFHYLDMERLAQAAVLGPTGAGLVFLGLSLMVSFTVLATALWIAR